MASGILYLVSTPIGNLGDISIRALEVLRRVERIAAEDTRHTRKLLTHYDIHTPLVSYHRHNETERSRVLVHGLLQGADLALVSDAGTPTISDPGSHLVRAAIDAGIRVEAVPGPSAVVTAVAISGLPSRPFAFLGFPPARGTVRKRFFLRYRDLDMTLVLFESPQRLGRTLKDLARHWGPRRVAVARELTKKFEEVFRGGVEEAAERFSGDVKGEITLVVEGRTDLPVSAAESDEWLGELRERIVGQGLSVKDAVQQIVDNHGLPRNRVYRAALQVSNDSREWPPDPASSR